MGAAGDEAERGFGAEPVEHGLETVRGAVEIESVGIADDQVDLAVDVGLTPRPVALDAMRDVVLVAPVSADGGVDGESVASGKRVPGRVDLGGRRGINNKTTTTNTQPSLGEISG